MVTDILAAITVVVVLPMCIATITILYPLIVRPLAYGMLFGSLGTAIIVGVSLGGIFDALGIPAVAFIPVVIVGAIALRWVIRYVPENRAPEEFRRASAVLNLILLAGVFTLVYLVIVAGSFMNSWLPVLVAVCALVVMVAGVRWLRRRVRFFKGVEMFTGRDTGFAILAGIVLFMGQGAFLYQLTAFFQNVWDMGPALAGVSFTPFVVGLLLGSFLVARLALRFRARRIIAGGFVVMGGSMLWLSFVQVESLVLVPACAHYIDRLWARACHTRPDTGGPVGPAGGSFRICRSGRSTASGQLGDALGVVLSSMLVTQLADFAFLKPLAQAGVPEATLSQIKEALPGVFNRAASGDYPNVPQAVLDLAATRYDQALTTGMGRVPGMCSADVFGCGGHLFRNASWTARSGAAAAHPFGSAWRHPDDCERRTKNIAKEVFNE